MADSALSNITKVAGTEFQLFHVRDEKSVTTNGGTFTQSVWQTRDLNTVVTNEIPGASLSSNQMTLPAGTYHIESTAPAFFVGQNKARLRDITNSSTLLTGSSQWIPSALVAATSATSNSSKIRGKMVLSATTTIELQHSCQTTQILNGFGVNGAQGIVEIFSDVRIWREVSALSIANIEPANLSSLIRATFDNVEIKRVTTSTISIESGRVGSDDGAVIIEITSPITVDITASGENGLDTGSEAVSTWYYVYAIRNPTTGTIKGLLSISPTSPTMPSGFTQKGLAGVFFNNAFGDIWNYFQIDNEVWYTSIITALSGGTATVATLVDLSAIVPPIAKTVSMDILATFSASGGSNSLLNVTPLNSTGPFLMRAYWNSNSLNGWINDNHGELPLLTPQTVWYYHTSPATNAHGNLWITGYKFKR